jgi:CheY-like chemotaxis protein
MTILIVDDEEAYRLILREILTDKGWDVLMACHGEEALQKLRATKVDLVVADIYMPVMDGIKLQRAIRETPALAGTPILFVSGADDEQTAGAVKDPRLEAFLRKSGPLEEMVKWIRYLTTREEKRFGPPPTGRKAKP